MNEVLEVIRLVKNYGIIHTYLTREEAKDLQQRGFNVEMTEEGYEEYIMYVVSRKGAKAYEE